MALSLICTDLDLALAGSGRKAASACRCLAGLIGSADALFYITDHARWVLSIAFIGIDPGSYPAGADALADRSEVNPVARKSALLPGAPLRHPVF